MLMKSLLSIDTGLGIRGSHRTQKSSIVLRDYFQYRVDAGLPGEQLAKRLKKRAPHSDGQTQAILGRSRVSVGHAD